MDAEDPEEDSEDGWKIRRGREIAICSRGVADCRQI